MNKMFKFFKTEIHHYLDNTCDHQSFRITGDCTPYNEYQN